MSENGQRKAMMDNAKSAVMAENPPPVQLTPWIALNNLGALGKLSLPQLNEHDIMMYSISMQILRQFLIDAGAADPAVPSPAPVQAEETKKP